MAREYITQTRDDRVALMRKWRQRIVKEWLPVKIHPLLLRTVTGSYRSLPNSPQVLAEVNS